MTWADGVPAAGVVVADVAGGTGCVSALAAADGDVDVKVAASPELAQLFEGTSFSRFVVDWRVPPAPGAFPLPKIVRTDSHDIEPAVQAAVRLPFANDYTSTWAWWSPAFEVAVATCCRRPSPSPGSESPSGHLTPEADRILAGRVQDHAGVPIPRAFFEIQIGTADDPTKFGRSQQTLSAGGRFLFTCEPGHRHTLVCRFGQKARRCCPTSNSGSSICLSSSICGH